MVYYILWLETFCIFIINVQGFFFSIFLFNTCYILFVCSHSIGCMLLCAYVLSFSVCMHVIVHACTHTYMWSPEVYVGNLPQLFYTLYFELVSQWTQRSPAQLVETKVPGILLSPPSQHWDYRCMLPVLCFSVCTWNMNSGHYVCAYRVLSPDLVISIYVFIITNVEPFYMLIYYTNAFLMKSLFESHARCSYWILKFIYT